MSYLQQPVLPTTPPTISRDDLASPWRRIVATLIDGLVWSIPLMIGCFLAFEEDEVTGAIEFVYPIWWWAVAYASGFLYTVVPVAIWGQTLGKHLVSIRVVSAQDLDRPGWWRAIRRWGIYIVAGLVPIIGGLLNCLLGLVGLVMLWAHHKRQTPHDLVADTLVVDNGVQAWAA